ncbi:MAG: hypothetical protein J0L75_08345 [Spirochaetes bacterium]|nr:hypothetical protein [Spirochaetota bacterium]
MELSRDQIHEHNLLLLPAHRRRWEALRQELSYRGHDPEALIETVRRIECVLAPGDLGGAGDFMGGGLARSPLEYLHDSLLIHRLTRLAPRLMPPAAWQTSASWEGLIAFALENKLRLDGQAPRSYPQNPGELPTWSLFNAFVDDRSRNADASGAIPFSLPPFHDDRGFDPLESCLIRIENLALCFLKARLVEPLPAASSTAVDDPAGRHERLGDAWQTDLRPLTAEYRLRTGAALHPFAAFRALGVRPALASQRPTAEA